MATSYPPLAEREIKNTICLFDVDGTLTPARLVSLISSPQALQWPHGQQHVLIDVALAERLA